MGRKKKNSSAKILMILWLVTAAVALVVTVVYFGELQKMYTAVSDDAESRNKDAAASGNEGTQVADNSGKTKAEVSPTGEKNTDVPTDGAKDGDKTNPAGTDKADTEGQGKTEGDKNPAENANSEAGSQKQDGNGETGKTTEGDNGNPGEDTGNKPDSNDDNAGKQDDQGADNNGEAQNNPENGGAGDNSDNSGDNSGDNNGIDIDNEYVSGDHPYYYDPDLDPGKPIIALSFDDGPGIYTKRVLAALEKYGAKATFFMVGSNVAYYPDEVKAVYEAGCEVGNHTTDHSQLTKLSESEIRKKVFDNEDAINKVVPVGEIPLRPPYGDYNDTVKKVVNRPMFNWSVDSLDWKTRNADSIVAQIKQDARDGYVILMHDIYQTTAEATERILPWLIEQGYQVTCISNMFAARGEETKPGHIYRYTDPAPKQE